MHIEAHLRDFIGEQQDRAAAEARILALAKFFKEAGKPLPVNAQWEERGDSLSLAGRLGKAACMEFFGLCAPAAERGAALGKEWAQARIWEDGEFFEKASVFISGDRSGGWGLRSAFMMGCGEALAKADESGASELARQFSACGAQAGQLLAECWAAGYAMAASRVMEAGAAHFASAGAAAAMREGNSMSQKWLDGFGLARQALEAREPESQGAGPQRAAWGMGMAAGRYCRPGSAKHMAKRVEALASGLDRHCRQAFCAGLAQTCPPEVMKLAMEDPEGRAALESGIAGLACAQGRAPAASKAGLKL